MERLENIDIDSYNFTVKELPILALIKLYLNAAEQPVEEIDRALDSLEGLMDLIENAKKSVEIQKDYDESIKYMIAVFLQKTDEVVSAYRYPGARRRHGVPNQRRTDIALEFTLNGSIRYHQSSAFTERRVIRLKTSRV